MFPSSALCSLSMFKRIRSSLSLLPIFKSTNPSGSEKTSKNTVEAQLTEEEYEAVLYKTQLTEALEHIYTLERKLSSMKKQLTQVEGGGRSGEQSALLDGTDDESEDLDEDVEGSPLDMTVFPTTTTNTASEAGIGNNTVARPNRLSTKSGGSSKESKAADRLLAVVRLSLRLKPGKIVALVGQVGAGKSSVFAGLLGDMRLVSGSVCMRGSVAYVGQRPYIMNCTVKDNILFGQPFDEAKYLWSLEVCALLPDMKVLPAGDMTEIGERGINLSGGQKARVALARAAYSNADIFLLDDPLSAVDAHVGQHLFEKCILALQGSGKCVLISTNALHFLRAVTTVIVLKEGKVVQSGSYSELIEESGPFSDMMATFDEGRTSAAALTATPSSKENGAMNGHHEDGSKHMNPKEIPKELKISNASANSGSSATNGSLMTVEDRETGSVDIKAYTSLIRATGGYLVVIGIVILFASCEAIALMSSWWLTQWSQYGTAKNVWFYYGCYCALNISVLMALFIRELRCRICLWLAGKTLFKDLLRSVMYSPLAFFDTTPLGRITNRLSKDVYTVDEQLPQTIRWYFGSMLKVLSTLLYACVVTPMFILGLFPIVMFYYTAQMFYVRTSRELSRLESSSRSPIYALFSETLDGLATIRAFRSESLFVSRISSLLDANQKAFFLNFSANCWLAVRLEMAGTLIVTFTALFAVLGRDSSAQSDESDARRQAFSGLAGLAISLALSVTQSLNWSVRMASDLESQMVAVERISSYINMTQEAPHHVNGDPKDALVWPHEGAINFDNVSLRYRPDTPRVLDGVSFQVKPKERVGIVGRTGAGKSSLVVALLRLVELDGGCIFIDGRSISELGLNVLRSAIAVIPQDPVLFSGTLRFNVDPFHVHSDVEVWDGLRRVQLGDSFDSLDAMIGEGASNLSVGQRQLICIARALLSKSKIIVMDEATAAVDVETDAIIQRAIRIEFCDSTCLTVAHRLNTIMDSDRVLVMDKGAVAEFDAPFELLKKEGGLFAGLVANWESVGK